MANGNGVNSIWKALATGSAVTVLGVVLVLFMYWHFAYVERNTIIQEESIKINQDLINTIDRLDRTISSQIGQDNLKERFASTLK